MRIITRAIAPRLAITAAAALLAVALGSSPVAADNGIVDCVSGSNPATGQTIQLCATKEGANVDNTAVARLTCVAQTGPVSESTTVGCYGYDVNTGAVVWAPIVTAPGDASSTAVTVQNGLDHWQICMFGSGGDVSGNVVSLPVSCVF
jgi:hypothetical protein